MNLRPGAFALVCITLSTAACGGRLIPSPIEGEPICPDFEIGATHAVTRGSLRYPVTVQLQLGKKTLTRTTLMGRRTSDEPPSRILVADDNAEYQLEWAQCENERAPTALTSSHPAKDRAEYVCGNATVYKTEPLVTKKGDPESRKLRFPAPPKTECWQSEVPKVEAPAASAPPPPSEVAAPAAADAGVEPADAGAVDAAAAATSHETGKTKHKKHP